MKILVLCMPVHPLFDRPSMNTMPTTAIYYLSSILTRNGHYVNVIDSSLIRSVLYEMFGIRSLKKYLSELANDADVIAFSSNTLNWSMTQLALTILEKCGITKPVIVGGLHSSYFYNHVLSTTRADFVIRGEGEHALPYLIEAIESGKVERYRNILGISYKLDGRVINNPDSQQLTKNELQDFPIPDFSMMPAGEYAIQPVATSKGCLFNCAFCSIPSRERWIGYDSAWVIRRIEEAYSKYQSRFLSNNIYITDDCFTADKARAITILAALNEKRSIIDAKYIIEARVNDLRHAPLCECIGQIEIVYRVACGIECGYDEGLKKIGKVLTIQQCNEMIMHAEKTGYINKLALSFIIGFPWEDYSQCIQTIDYAASLAMKFGITVNLNWLLLFPSRIWNDRKKFGIELDESFFDDFTLVNSLGISTHNHDLAYATDYINKYSMFSPHSNSYIRPHLKSSDIERVNAYICDYEAKGIMLRNP